MKLNIFQKLQFLSALKSFFRELNVPINYVADEPITAKKILQDTYKDNETFNLINDVYFVGMVDDAAFRGENSIDAENIKSDYDGILIFGITLNQRANHLPPTRSQLAEITRAFNREFYYTPVALVFKYDSGKNHYIAFSSAERLKYKQEWREGEKAGKVSLLRDINIEHPHRGHENIINQLKIQLTGINAVDSFEKLYKYWQEVFNVSILNKKFYRELQSWYFWAIKEVTFPNAPNRFDFESDEKFDEALKEHKGKNVIRLLTRLLFIWFIKEKKLVPEEIFDENYVANNLIKDFTPQKPHGIFATGKHNSMYYRAILQNLFFATLNQEMGKRKFRKPKKHMNVSNLMRYQSYFKEGGDNDFLKLMNTVPFMNGGLFECLDKPHPEIKGKHGGDIIIYEDGFSDRDDNVVEVPDFLFFDVEEEVDISDDIGSKNRIYKEAKTRGLLEILKSYKFTITENTPIEEDVALDPELLGKVFENLLASYNPETKTTARKQTGSFYTPREIVNYMVDESLIAYLKNTIKWDGIDEEQFDKDLHILVAFDNPQNPFENNAELQNQIIKALDKCKILDPACGSGAFPMGILQKMVHILYKVDPNNTEWKHRQLLRVDSAIKSLEELDDVEFREKSIIELTQQKIDIEEAFKNNELDYGRKLYLIENCIYGVDIQSIATQISKLRFFISLVVDQKIEKTKPNFGVRPLPNLETKFVAANTLISIEKPDQQYNMYDNIEVKRLENKLKDIRHKLFSSKSPARKRELREEDKILREQIADLLKNNGWRNETARQLASWDPYDQNASSSFFDAEWMFDVPKGFDILIGNPPYHQLSKDSSAKKTYKEYLKRKYNTSAGRLNLFIFFTHEAINLAKKINGVVTYIIPNTILTQEYYSDTRKKILQETTLLQLVNYDEMPFENAVVENVSFVLKNSRSARSFVKVFQDNLIVIKKLANIEQNKFLLQKNYTFNINSNDIVEEIISNKKHRKVLTLCEVNQGIALKGDKSLSLKYSNPENKYYKLLDGRNINKYKIEWDGIYLDYDLSRIHSCKRKDIFETKEKLFFRRVSKNLIFTYDDKQFYSLNTIVVVNKKQNCKDNLKVLLAIFNSDILNYIYQKQYKSTKKVFSEIQARSVKELPIPVIDIKAEKALLLISSIQIYKNINEKIFSSVSNAIVNQLYFPEHMKERNLDVLQFVERDIEALWAKNPNLKIRKSEDFDILNDIEKDEIIAQLRQTWSDSNNELVKRISQFKTKSPDVLKLILEN